MKPPPVSESPKAKRIKRWGQIRQRGKWNFIWRMGLLYWAFPVSMLTGLLTHFLMPLYFDSIPLSESWAALWPPAPVDVLVYGIIWGLAGLGFGYSMWRINERAYQHASFS